MPHTDGCQAFRRLLAGALSPSRCQNTHGMPKARAPAIFEPARNVDRKVLRNLRAHLEAMREGAGPDIEILLDLNFNCSTEVT